MTARSSGTTRTLRQTVHLHAACPHKNGLIFVLAVQVVKYLLCVNLTTEMQTFKVDFA
jgi:hypothetical protein